MKVGFALEIIRKIFAVSYSGIIFLFICCGLGGGSLINAGVALKPDARVFADSAWPDELATDGLLELGFKRAATMLRPARCFRTGADDPRRGSAT